MANENKPNFRSTQNLASENMNVLGKIPPHSIEMEETVLGQLLIAGDACSAIMDVLKPESFYKESHSLLFKAIQKLTINDEPVDILTVSEQLKRDGNFDKIGGYATLSQLSLKVSSAANIEYHAKLIAQSYIQRELIRVSREIEEQAFDPATDVADLLDFSESSIFSVAEGTVKRETSSINTLLPQAIQQIKEAAEKGDGLSGVPTGFTDLDRITSGWQNSNMVVIAARPAMGKTAFVLSMLRNIAIEHGMPVAMFSLEMSNIQLVNRLIVSETEISHEKIKVGRLDTKDWEILEEKTKNLIEAPIYLDDTPSLSIFEFRAKCRRLKQKYDIKCIFIDYLQLMTSGSSSFSREQEVSTISRQIKAVAKELDVPIIALSQVSRQVEQRGGNKRPQLSDLRESGAIEQDADLVLFIHRPEYYGITEDQETGESLRGIAEIIVAKNRHGSVGDVRLVFKKELAKFIDVEKIDEKANIDIDEAIPTNLSESIKTIQSRINNDLQNNDEDIFGPNSDFDSNQDAPF